MYVRKDLYMDLEIEFNRLFYFYEDKYDYRKEIELLLSKTSIILTKTVLSDEEIDETVEYIDKLLNLFNKDMEGLDHLSFVISYGMILEELLEEYEERELYEQCSNIKKLMERI